LGLHLLHALLLGCYGRLEDAIEQLEIETKYVNRSTLIFARNVSPTVITRSPRSSGDSASRTSGGSRWGRP
jgi:hypothetical protein